MEPIVHKRYDVNNKLCVVQCMGVYIGSLLMSREINQLLLTYGTAHKLATLDTIFCWIENNLSAGVDTKKFQAVVGQL